MADEPKIISIDEINRIGGASASGGTPPAPAPPDSSNPKTGGPKEGVQILNIDDINKIGATPVGEQYGPAAPKPAGIMANIGEASWGDLAGLLGLPANAGAYLIQMPVDAVNIIKAKTGWDNLEDDQKAYFRNKHSASSKVMDWLESGASDPFAGPKWWERRFKEIGAMKGVTPQTPNEQLAAAGAHGGMAMASLGAGAEAVLLNTWMKGEAAMNAALRSAPKLLPTIAETFAGSGITSNYLMGVTGGVTGEYAQRYVPDWAKPTVRALGEVAGGLPVAIFSSSARKLINDIGDTLSTGYSAARKMIRGAESPEGLRTGLANYESTVPGFEPTVGQASGDKGVLGMEKKAASEEKSQAAFRTRAEEQNRSLWASLNILKDPAASITNFKEYLAGKIKSIADSGEENVTNAGKAVEESLNMAGGKRFSDPTAYGDSAREQIANIHKEADRQVARLKNLVDPDRNIMVSTEELKSGIEDAYGPADKKAAKPPAGEEARLLKVISEYGDQEPFAELVDLHTSLVSEIRKERVRTPGAETSVAESRMTKALAVVEDVLASKGAKAATDNPEVKARVVSSLEKEAEASGPRPANENVDAGKVTDVADTSGVSTEINVKEKQGALADSYKNEAALLDQRNAALRSGNIEEFDRLDALYSAAVDKSNALEKSITGGDAQAAAPAADLLADKIRTARDASQKAMDSAQNELNRSTAAGDELGARRAEKALAEATASRNEMAQRLSEHLTKAHEEVLANESVGKPTISPEGSSVAPGTPANDPGIGIASVNKDPFVGAATDRPVKKQVTVDGESMSITLNPTQAQVARIAQESGSGDALLVHDPDTGRFYVWESAPSQEADESVMRALGIKDPYQFLYEGAAHGDPSYQEHFESFMKNPKEVGGRSFEDKMSGTNAGPDHIVNDPRIKALDAKIKAASDKYNDAYADQRTDDVDAAWKEMNKFNNERNSLIDEINASRGTGGGTQAGQDLSSKLTKEVPGTPLVKNYNNDKDLYDDLKELYGPGNFKITSGLQGRWFAYDTENRLIAVQDRSSGEWHVLAPEVKPPASKSATPVIEQNMFGLDSNFLTVNRSLRMKKGTLAEVADMDREFATNGQPLPSDTLFRVIEIPIDGKLAQDLQAGKPMTDRGYFATSTDEARVNQIGKTHMLDEGNMAVIFHVNGEGGAPVKAIHNPKENEYLIQRGTTFDISNPRMVDGMLHVDATPSKTMRAPKDAASAGDAAASDTVAESVMSPSAGGKSVADLESQVAIAREKHKASGKESDLDKVVSLTNELISARKSEATAAETARGEAVAGAQERFAIAKTAEDEKRALYETGPVGEVLRQGADEGTHRMAGSKVADNLIDTPEKFSAFVAAAKGDPSLRDTVRDYAAFAMRAFTMRDGLISPERLRTWVENHKYIIDQFPELGSRLRDVGTARAMLDDAIESQKAALDAFQTKAVERVLGTGRVVDSVGTSLGKPGEFGDLVAKVAGDADATQGLKNAVVEHIIERATASGESGTSGLKKLDGAALESMINKYRESLEKLFTPEQVESMANVAREYQIAARTADAVKGNDITGRRLSSLALLAIRHGGEFLGTVIGAGLGHKTGGTIGHVMGGASSGYMAGVVGDYYLVKQLGKIDKAVADMLLNPKVAQEWINKVHVTEMNRDTWSENVGRKLRALMANALVDDTEESTGIKPHSRVIVPPRRGGSPQGASP
jgi:hypothetical protein